MLNYIYMKKWLLHKFEPELSYKLSSEFKLSPTTSQILINRGIKDPSSAEAFLKPRLSHLKDPLEIPELKTAAQRVLLARERKEKILIYGDYDVDGVTGTTILIETLRLLGMDPAFYIPYRYGEGYSLNKEAIQKIKKDGTNLIITVDCGISSYVEVELANSLGMEVIITDHHNLPLKLPNAFARVNPKMIKGDHVSKDLSGAGVAFKFAWGLLRLAGVTESTFLTRLLDLVALGTVADVVSLTDENRILTVQGLNYLNQKRRLGIEALAEAASIRSRISVSGINFGLSPRLNAAGRLEHASLAVNLLTSRDEHEAKKLAEKLNRINVKRQGIGQNIQKEVFNILDSDPEQKIMIASGKGWHPGVIGIVASQVVDRYFRPAVLISINEHSARGSARSLKGFNIFALLETARDLFLDFGGHENAAGFELEAEKIPEFEKRIKENIEPMIDCENLIPKILIDTEIESSNISLGLIKEIEALQPFGQGNPAPLFMTRGLLLGDIRRVGADGAHLKLKLSDGKIQLETIGFRQGDLANKLELNKSYDIAYNLESNEWNGFETAQLRLIDIREETK